MTSRREVSLNYLILVVFSVVALWPVVTILISAFGSATTGAGAGLAGLHPENFATAWQEGHFTQYMRNSVMVSALVVVLSVSCSVLSGYAFGTMTFRGSGVLFYLFLLGIMVPSEVIVVPLFFDLRQLGLTDTIWAVALPQVAQSIAFGTYWMRTYFRTSNRSIFEAARIDGASSGQILLRVQVPIARPAIVTLVVLVFMWTWNEFLIPLVMSPNGQMRTAPLGLAFFQGQYSTNTALMGAAAVLVALPVVVVYLFLQRHFIGGMVEGAVKD
jgi:raffinose/stachyose/melibiose transport system permease protein